MNITIKKAERDNFHDCMQCLKHSNLWDTYFDNNPLQEKKIKDAIAKKQIYMALNKNGSCIGFFGVIHNGCFRAFSYLSIVAVKKRYRSKGIGTQLVQQFEEQGFKKGDRVFLLVGEYNARAQSLYKKLGYKKVGRVPSMFKEGVSEHIMIKYKPE